MAKLTLQQLQAMKLAEKKITMLTLYDASFAYVASNNDVDILFVGDSLGMVLHGQENTLAVTIDDIVYHTRAVVTGNVRSLVMSDLPFMTYYNLETAALYSRKLLQAGANIVKLEGGDWLADTIYFLTQRGVPVCGHLGLTPQSIHLLGGFKVQGKTASQAKQIMNAALELEQAGAQLLVLECVPYTLAQEITASLTIPVIGIGAGPYCDGQVLVIYDILGLTPEITPRFTKNYLDTQSGSIAKAIKNYCLEVQTGLFPTLEHSFQ